MNIIEAENLQMVYGENDEAQTYALRDIDLTIREGEFVAIMGPSGSGKSTLLHILGFLDRQTSGEYRFLNKSINEYTEDELAHIRNKEMGFIFQSFNLLARSTVLENVMLPLLYSKTPEEEWESRAIQAIESVGLSHRIYHESSELSGGEKQRVAIARAVVNEPNIIFADEPTGNLDSKSGAQIMEIIQKFNNEGKTIILITHETYTSEYAQRIVTLHDGVVATDKPVKKRRKVKDGFKK
ncbi:macrolide ABC transporter ATP-binding protein [bacterium]|nr:macrolide ABC transporter ATP-binding protein [bacterium]|tara:strand:+ start:10066 stop:10785 length:720 start_codon:yes stop_codon:yes gene_type:complete